MSIKNSGEKTETVVKTANFEETKPSEKARLFSKNQLLASERFRERRDLLNALLSSDKQYTVEAVEQEISKYMKGQVK